MNKRLKLVLFAFLHFSMLSVLFYCSSEARKEAIIPVREEMKSEQEKSPAIAPPPKPTGAAVQDIKRKNNKEESDGKIPDKQKTDSFNSFAENPFVSTSKEKFSTFSLKVDTASYSMIRSFVNQGQKPNKDSVRIEEIVNYFPWKYRNDAQEKSPIYLHTEMTDCPWNKENALLRVIFQTREIPASEIPPMNLVFLLDVSGSMSDANKLPLLKKSLRKVIDKMRDDDKIAIVVYAAAEGLALPSTSGKDRDKILSALNKLESGGSTNGGAGITLAYKVAEENFIKDGVNRIILGTDGDFNVGVTGKNLVDMIAKKRETGIYMTLLGLGMGNYKDDTMENISKEGNGNYFYIDTEAEADKVFVENFSATLLTVANDTKLQVEFNPQTVISHRLIGYENRMLATKDFKDDKKDAGEVGPGHIVTAFYELKLKGKESDFGTVRSRYKIPPSNEVKEISAKLPRRKAAFEEASPEFHFASGAVAFGLILRDSKFKGKADWKLLKQILSKKPPEYLQSKIGEFKEITEKAEKLK
ncbi:MAG TPA: von Willebrand factor type A domain-containing protein [Leptospiraceae bacterium]|nr:von Willebrand factor type A domain-containing protein [Leptospiraceae bacterium]